MGEPLTFQVAEEIVLQVQSLNIAELPQIERQLSEVALAEIQVHQVRQQRLSTMMKAFTDTQRVVVEDERLESLQMLELLWQPCHLVVRNVDLLESRALGQVVHFLQFAPLQLQAFQPFQGPERPWDGPYFEMAQHQLLQMFQSAKMLQNGSNIDLALPLLVLNHQNPKTGELPESLERLDGIAT